ncbi:hypothetical protein [Parasphingorhabdus halotolerans]|uniref:SMODS and SLOG-associating 2TM effector domain-containing protein n=1 Tax=Parasphingorhabdus halotolerans TaxID=2725558 RepID=A0A6H2DK52_9SPHN|nr:hypothetical protein [Parasphingorhabdus halotolerans]QJB68517.1 hypothetical protein HF685_03780 [Parasphingorhabdus halotolerans]
MTSPPVPNKFRFSIGVTGHRAAHASFAANNGQVKSVIEKIFGHIDQAVEGAGSSLGPEMLAPTRLHTLMVDGTDQAAAEMALARNWELISPLPFGARLNAAINAMPTNAADARALLSGDQPADTETRKRAEAILSLTGKAKTFELADQDDAIAELYLTKLDAPEDFAKAQAFALESATRAALAGRILIEQSDLIIGVWDGKSTASLGGTGHTIATALDLGAPVIWIDPTEPEGWKILHSPESLAVLQGNSPSRDREAQIQTIVRNVICPQEEPIDRSSAHHGLAALQNGRWYDRSASLTHGYRRIEALFGGGPPFRSIVQTYEKPEDIGKGSGAEILNAARALPGADPLLAGKIEQQAMQNFAWADGISARLSDHYRGGMVVNFLLSSLAIVGGIAYLPLVPADHKWGFALFEFLLLIAIVVITWRGQKYRWHGRWFETRRVAEYFRHSPLLLMMGVARAPGRWPKGTDTSWPEWYVLHALRDIGLPNARISDGYLRSCLSTLLDGHVVPQRDYHFDKAQRLKTVHHNLDRFSELLFKLAIISVAAYLVLKGGSALHLIDAGLLAKLSKTFTLLGVMFPTFGGAIAGIRFFGDFERFAAISEVTAERLEAIAGRIKLLQTAPDDTLSYDQVAELVHATDEVVIAEIENWQAVFSGKHITVPV